MAFFHMPDFLFKVGSIGQAKHKDISYKLFFSFLKVFFAPLRLCARTPLIFLHHPLNGFPIWPVVDYYPGFITSLLRKQDRLFM
jgi:hypothetical protein